MPGAPDSDSASAAYTVTCVEAVTASSGLAVEASMYTSSSSDIASDHASTGAAGITAQLADGNARNADCDVPVVVAFGDDTVPDSAARRFLLLITSADLVPPEAQAAPAGAADSTLPAPPADSTAGASTADSTSTSTPADTTAPAAASPLPAGPQATVISDEMVNLLQAQAGGQ